MSAIGRLQQLHAALSKGAPPLPIAPDREPLYPGGSIKSPEWQEIRAEIRARSGGRCEGCEIHPTCQAVDGEAHPETGSRVFLTVAHLNHDPEDNGEPGNRPNLAHLCQRCHLAHDRLYHLMRRRQNRDSKRGQLWMDFEGDTACTG